MTHPSRTYDATDGTPLDQETLDRLVDGELSDDDYRDALRRLDGEVGGWRRCALAFLEAQAWSREIQTPVAAPPTKLAETDVAPTVPSPQPRKQLGWTAEALALCACALLAFAVGIGVRDLVTGGSDAPEPFIDGGQPHLVNKRPLDSQVPQGAASAGLTITPESLTLVVDGGETPQEVTVPVMKLDEQSAPLLSGQHPIAPVGLRELLLRGGGKVLREERLVAPVQLRTGQHVLLPIEQWEIVPSEDPAFQ